MSTKRIRLDIAYDGAPFHGWARQSGLRTVQGQLEAALSTILRSPTQLTVAGRTDAGVHARGQVAHFDVPVSIWQSLGDEDDRICQSLVRRVNSVMGMALAKDEVLPASKQLPAVVLRAQVVTPEFDARFSALSRHYIYRICDDVTRRDPLRTDVYWHDRPLDVAAMNRAASALLGEHDFIGFCRPREGASTVRNLQVFRFDRQETSVIEATVQADAFCHSMVRSLIGACLKVGEGRQKEDWPAQILAKASRQDAAPIAPAHGLTLEAVTYPQPSEWATQAQAARTFRE